MHNLIDLKSYNNLRATNKYNRKFLLIRKFYWLQCWAKFANKKKNFFFLNKIKNCSNLIINNIHKRIKQKIQQKMVIKLKSSTKGKRILKTNITKFET